MSADETVALRKWKMTDAHDLVTAINNEKVVDNLRDGLPYPYTICDAEKFIGSIQSAEKDSQYIFAITYGGKVIGSIGILRKECAHRLTGELGYYIAEPYWGKGIAAEAIRQICAYVFNCTDIVRIFAQPYANNAASIRVLQKAGFRAEGILRSNAVKNGQILDVSMHALIKEITA